MPPNPSHLSAVRAGQAGLTAWRRKHPDRRLLLSGVSLPAADLSGAVLRGAELRDADLSGAGLVGSDLSRCDLTGANFTGADLTGADLREASVGQTQFQKTRLDTADLRNIAGHAATPDFSGASMRGVRLSGADLTGACLAFADLSGADLGGADLSGTDLHGALLREASAGWSSFYGAGPDQWRRLKPSVRFHDADLRAVDGERANLVGASFVGADLSDANLAGANLAGADFGHAVVMVADLSGADLSEADLTAADLSDARLVEAVLLGANLHRARLGGATLHSAWLGDTILAGTHLDEAAGTDSIRHIGPSPSSADTWLVVGDDADRAIAQRALLELGDQGLSAWWVAGDRFLADRPRLRCGQLLDLAVAVVGVVPAGGVPAWWPTLQAVAADRSATVWPWAGDESISALVGRSTI